MCKKGFSWIIWYVSEMSGLMSSNVVAGKMGVDGKSQHLNNRWARGHCALCVLGEGMRRVSIRELSGRQNFE